MAITQHPIGTFHRLDGHKLQLPLATLWARTAAFTGPEFLQAAGFYNLAEATGPIQVPELTTLFADMRTTTTIGFYKPKPVGDPTLLVEATFPDPHTPAWADDAHTAGQLCVLVSDQAVTDHPSPFDFLATAWVAMIPLGLYAFAAGVGTRP